MKTLMQQPTPQPTRNAARTIPHCENSCTRTNTQLACPTKCGIRGYSFDWRLTSDLPTGAANMAHIRTSTTAEKHCDWLTVRAIAKEKPKLLDLNMNATIFFDV